MNERGSQGRLETPEVVYSWFQNELEKVYNTLVKVSEEIIQAQENVMHTGYNLDKARERYFELLRRRDYVRQLEPVISYAEEVEEIQKSLDDVLYLIHECRVDNEHAKSKLDKLRVLEVRLRKMESDLIDQENVADDMLASLPPDAIRN